MKQQLSMHRRYAGMAFAFVLIFFCLQVANSQQQKRDVSDFNEISYSLSGALEIMQGDTEELILMGDQEDLEKIITRVDGNTLKIYTKNNVSRIGKVNAMVTVKRLNALSLAGSGNVEFKTDLKTDEFELELSGSGNIVCPNLTARELEIELAGSGDITVGGEISGELDLQIAGSGNIDCAGLKAKEVDVEIAGSGNVRVWATDQLKSRIVGSGSVYYKGNPLVDSETTGSGKTKPL